MARLSYPEPGNLSEEMREILRLAPDINIFRMLGHCDTLAGPFLALGAGILLRSRIDPVLRELAIVRAAVHAGSAYELNQHDAIAREVGVSQEKIEALREGPDSPLFSDRERAILRFTDEVALNVKASDRTFAEVAAFLDPCEIQELIIAIGYYSMVGRFLETLEVELEEGDRVEFVRVGDLRHR